jgi:GH15 family glucan-1,4-alpha-glucosidase
VRHCKNHRIEIREVLYFAPSRFDAALVESVRKAAASLGLSCRDIVSGAAHDAVYINRIAPTAMIFVPCAGGLSHNSAKNDMQDGYLSNQREELGDVDTAYAWNFWLRPGEEFVRDFIISAATSEPTALAQLAQSREAGFDALYELADHWWDAWLSSALPVQLDERFTETYYRSLLATRLLYDERYGSFLAAPEFDPMFERCGGYGFVWPRDAAEVVLALETAGFPDMVERFFEWARTAQHGEGYWEQRYWISGERGPGWCSFLDSIQIDQTGSMVHALGVHADRLPAHERPGFQERYWTVAENAVNYLMAALGENGLHTQAFDLW